MGSRLRECRLALNLSIGEVAEAQNASKQTISAQENGDRRIDAEALADLALLYGVSSDYILFGTHMVPEDLKALFSRFGSPAGPGERQA